MCPHDEHGRELPDPTPVAIPSGVGRPESLTDTIRRMVRNEVSQMAAEHGAETFEEANDFDEDDDDFTSPYELTPMQEEFLSPADRPTTGAKDDDHDEAVDGVDRGTSSSSEPDDGDRVASKAKGGVRRPPAKPAGDDGGGGASSAE